MEYALYAIFAIILAAILVSVFLRRAVIYEYQRGLLFRNGKCVATLGPGMHYIFRPSTHLQVIDIRLIHVTLPGQEILSADNVGLKVSLAAGYKVADPYLAVTRVVKFSDALYLLLQMNLRDVVGSLAIDDLLVKREEIGKILLERSAHQAAEMGLELQFANIKDIMFPGELKNIFAQVVNARKEGLAALEKARGESAALRNLANAASLFENNPNLMQLRLLQSLEKNSGNTVVILPADGNGAANLLNRTVRKSEQ